MEIACLLSIMEIVCLLSIAGAIVLIVLWIIEPKTPTEQEFQELNNKLNRMALDRNNKDKP